MLLPLPMLNYQEIGNFFIDKNLELLIVDKKVSFDGNTSSFNSSYFCSNVLPKSLIFHGLEHNNSNKFYTPSRMYKDMIELLQSNYQTNRQQPQQFKQLRLCQKHRKVQ